MLTFTVLFSVLLKLSSRAREDRVCRADFLCNAGSSDKNSELVSNSIDLLFGVVAIGSAPGPPLLLRNITILTPKRPFSSTDDGVLGQCMTKPPQILLTTQAHLSPPLQSPQILLTAQAHLSPPLQSPQILLTAQAHLSPPLQSPQILLTAQAHLSPPLQSPQILLTAQAHLSPPLQSPQILLTAQAHLSPPLQSP
ncbi:hypothetical protein NQZ68_039940 [Dissostichus eleginoides]|nr:hypothetical protein NQZ68_039940 [Dissostichus eleginoides]